MSVLAALAALAAFAGGVTGGPEPAAAAETSVRVKDIAQLKGVRSNQLIGYGLVVGLQSTGDNPNNIQFTVQSLMNMLERIGVSIDPATLRQVRAKNVAAVLVTGQLPPFARVGSRIDVTVSSIGDAQSLQGGTLIQTPLTGPDGQVYALAQGPLSIGGFIGGSQGGGGGGTTIQKNHPTVGKVPSGATVEREVPVDLTYADKLQLILHQEDFTTAARLAGAILQSVPGTAAQARDARTVVFEVPEAYRGKIVELYAQIENLQIGQSAIARIVLNERTGTVVVGENVRLSPVAVAHGNLSIQIATELGVSQPAPLSTGQTVITPNASVAATEERTKMLLMDEAVTIDKVVRALNSLGVTPRDLVAILQAMREAGALHAELVMM
ncbi:MAG: flagellar basal body P-ring protein FlgI [Candidatus Schekmanbacteria bacterium]|nr:flagellar basal body P-ring protein FlgI [Candidatus Schekmanbacteria bacterium]